MTHSTHSIRSLQLAILEVLANTSKAHKISILGRPYQPGTLEHRLQCTFVSADRSLAYKALERLLSDGLISPTFDDLVDPEAWMKITERGMVAVQRRALDDLDERLQLIDPHLVIIRDGAWSAVTSNEPDALRQAAHSARELIEQVLKQAAPDDQVKQQSWYAADATSRSGITRKHRLRYVMQRFRSNESESDLRVADQACELVLALNDRLMALAHARSQPSRSDVEDAMSSAEIALRRILLSRHGN